MCVPEKSDVTLKQLGRRLRARPVVVGLQHTGRGISRPLLLPGFGVAVVQSVLVAVGGVETPLVHLL